MNKKEYNQLVKDLRQCCEMQSTIETQHELENTWIRRFFRLYLDGSYTSYEDYKNNCKIINDANGNVKKLRMFIKNKFIDFLVTEYKFSRYTITKAIFEAFNYNTKKCTLELFNCNLIEDALEMAKGVE
mgnify:CR=1 FL=1|tara:strand:+ start:196 stop:582 length:387 start_codon:yes stop_codon:yes gene_type:complete